MTSAADEKFGLLGDKKINRVGYGAMQLAGPGVWGPPRDRRAAISLLRRAIELGVDHIDTSQYYGPDVVNELIREALAPYPEGLRLVTKVGARRDSRGGWLPADSPGELRAGVEENLRTLGVERIDAVNLRVMRGDGMPREEQLAVLQDMQHEGKVDLIGVSNVGMAGLSRALELAHVACVQNAYNVLDRRDEKVLEACQREGVAYVPFFPLGSAGQRRLANERVIGDVAERYGATSSQVALTWLLQHSPRILLIPGTTSEAHLEENVAASDLRLQPEDIARLDALSGG